MKHYIGAGNPMRAQFEPKSAYWAEHFSWAFEAGVGTITLNLDPAVDRFVSLGKPRGC